MEEKLGVPKTITLVESQIPGVYLIPMAELVQDTRNRIKVSNYEIEEIAKDTRNLGKALRPYVDQFIQGVKDFRDSLKDEPVVESN